MIPLTVISLPLAFRYSDAYNEDSFDKDTVIPASRASFALPHLAGRTNSPRVNFSTNSHPRLGEADAFQKEYSSCPIYFRPTAFEKTTCLTVFKSVSLICVLPSSTQPSSLSNKGNTFEHVS